MLEVIDYYCIVNFEISDFIYYCCELVGCIVIILNKMYKENGVIICKEVVGLMLFVIILDFLLFKFLICIE